MFGVVVNLLMNMFGVDHPSGGLHVPVHPLLRRADHGPLETGAPPQTHPHLLSSTCGRGLLQRYQNVHVWSQRLERWFKSCPLLSRQCTAAAVWRTSPSPASAWPCPSSDPSSTSTSRTSAFWRTSSPTSHVSGRSSHFNPTACEQVPTAAAALPSRTFRYDREDLRGEEGPVRRLRGQPEREDLQGRAEASAPPQRRRQGEVQQAHGAEVEPGSHLYRLLNVRT